MTFFDVTVLFTSIEISLAKETLSLLLTNDRNLVKYMKLQSQSLLQLIDLCLTINFQFNNKIYEQTKETPMGSSISRLIEEVMEIPGASILLAIKPRIWIRHVDDMFVIVKKNELENTYNLTNIFDDIKFAMEKELKNKLSLLNVLITRTNTRKLDTQVYQKSVHTDPTSQLQ